MNKCYKPAKPNSTAVPTTRSKAVDSKKEIDVNLSYSDGYIRGFELGILRVLHIIEGTEDISLIKQQLKEDFMKISS